MATLKLAIDARSLLATAKQVEHGLAGIKSSAESAFHRVSRAADIALGPLKLMVSVTASLKAMMLAAGAASVGAAGDYEMFNQQLRTVIATKKDADRAFAESIEFSVRTPFTPDDIVRTRVELEAVGVRGSAAVEKVASAAAAMNREMSDVASAVKSMETEPLRRLGIRLQREGDEFIFQFRDKVGQAQRIAATGFEEAQAALLSIFETKYSGGLERMSITWQGLISTLKGAVKDLRAEFGAGFLDQSKLIVNDLIEGSKQLKQYAGEAGREFGDEMIIARAHLLAGFDTALKVAGQIKEALKQEGGAGEVILQAFRLGTTLLADAMVTAFQVSLPLWKTIGTILGQGVLDALYRSGIPGSGIAREMAISRNLGAKSIQDLQKVAGQFNIPTSAAERVYVAPDIGVKGGYIEYGQRLKTAKELVGDLTGEIKKLSVEEQIAFAEFDPGAAIAKSIDESRQKITDAIAAMGAETIAQLQEFENNLAAASGQDAIDLTKDFTQNLSQRLSEGEELIKQWREKLNMQAGLGAGGGMEVPEGAGSTEKKANADDDAKTRIEITARMYDDMGKLGTGYYNSQKGLLELQKTDYGKYIEDKVLLDEWYNTKLAQLAVESSGFWLETRSALQSTQSALSDFMMDFASLEGLIDSIGQSFQRMFANLASQMAMSGIMNLLVGGDMAGAMGFQNPMAGAGKVALGGLLGSLFGGAGAAPVYQAHAMGGVFDRGRLVPMAGGAVLDSPTYFPMAGGKIGLMGEGGTEAAMPLKRMRSGRLGVETGGTQPVTVNPTPVKIVFVKNQKEAAIEAMRSEQGQNAIMMAIRENGL